MTPAEILALPERGLIAYREIKCGCGRTNRVPYAERALAMTFSEDDAMCVIDENGDVWVPFQTESGTYRRRVS